MVRGRRKSESTGGEPLQVSEQSPGCTNETDLRTRMENLESRFERASISGVAVALLTAVLGSGGVVGLDRYLDSRTIQGIEAKLKEQELQIRTQGATVKHHEVVAAMLRKSIQEMTITGRSELVTKLTAALEVEIERFITWHRLHQWADK